jgi:hypothetical protein
VRAIQIVLGAIWVPALWTEPGSNRFGAVVGSLGDFGQLGHVEG